MALLREPEPPRPKGPNMNSRKYEAIFIVKPELADADVQKIADRFKNLVEEKGGTVENAGKWEKRKLAYEMEGYKEGNYVLMNFECGPAVPQELSRLLGIHDDVIRHRVFKVE
jgi:small subunit ribosomal protein S6